jgi:hypothetical protein
MASGDDADAYQSSRRLDDQIGVGDRTTGTDQTNGMGHAFFEFNMGFKNQRDFLKTRGERRLDGFIVMHFELCCSIAAADHEILANRVEYLQDRGHVINEGYIHGFDLWPKGKSPISNDQGIRVTNAGEQLEHRRIEQARLDHKVMAIKIPPNRKATEF